MTCGVMRELTSAYIEGEVTAEERTALDAHLAMCESCRADVDDVSQLLAAVHAVRPVRVPPNFTDAVMARVAETNTDARLAAQRRVWRLPQLPTLQLPGYVWAPALAAAALAVIVFLPRAGRNASPTAVPQSPVATVQPVESGSGAKIEVARAEPGAARRTHASPIRRVQRTTFSHPPEETAVATRNPIIDTQAVSPDGFLLSGTRLEDDQLQTEWVLDQVSAETAGILQRASATPQPASPRPQRKRSLTF